MSLNDDLLEEIISHKVDLLRFSESVREKVLANLASLGEDIQSQIQDADLSGITRPSMKLKRQEALINQTADTVATAYRDNGVVLDRELLELSDISQNFAVNLLNDGFKANVASVTFSRAELEKIVSDILIQGAPSADWWAKQSTDLQHRFAQQIRMGLLQGETNDELVKRIRGFYDGTKTVVELPDGTTRSVKNFNGGVMSISQRDATALVRTSVQTVSNSILEDTYTSNQDVLKGVQAIATLDFRTTPYCRSIDGGAWDFKGQPLPQSKVKSNYPGPPPYHFQCRTVVAPITKSWDDLVAEAGGTTKGPIANIPPTVRASMDGEVAADLKYEDWLKSKTVAQQKEILGETKWQLWQDHKLSFQEMIDQSGNTLTIDQLKARVAGDQTLLTHADYSPESLPPPTTWSGDLTGDSNGAEKVLEKWGTKDTSISDVMNAMVANSDVFSQAILQIVPDELEHNPSIQVMASDDSSDSRLSSNLSLSPENEMVITNDYFQLDSSIANKGVGTDIFYSQVKNAQKLGVSKLQTFASAESGLNGYYTWARLGYDGPIPSSLLSKLPPVLQDAQLVSDLMKSAVGRQWWKQNGISVELTFDLTPGSLSMQILEGYIESKMTEGTSNG